MGEIDFDGMILCPAPNCPSIVIISFRLSFTDTFLKQPASERERERNSAKLLTFDVVKSAKKKKNSWHSDIFRIFVSGRQEK